MTPRFLYLLKYRICHIPRSYLIDACFSLIGICREFSWDVTYIATFDNLISLSNTCCWDQFTLNFIQHLFELDMSSHVGFAFVSLVFFSGYSVDVQLINWVNNNYLELFNS